MALTIGPTQKRVLKYLALNPNQHAQGIQRALGIPDRNYPSVHKALSKLHEQELVEYQEALSNKKVPIKLWRLTEKGISATIAYLDLTAEEITEVFKNYSSSEKHQELLKLMLETLGPELFKRFINTYIAVKSQSDVFATLTLFAQLQEELKSKKLSPEENERIEKFLEKVMQMNVKTRLAYKALKKLGIL